MKKRIIYLIISLILLAIALYLYYVVKDYSCVRISDYLGNKRGIINKLQNTEDKMPFSFAFISDTENGDASIWLIKKMLKQNIDFMVFAGDVANEGILSEHKLFINTISCFKPKIPIFLIASNHDVERSNDNKAIDFTKRDFETIYGPMNFSFTYNNCLFIFISNIGQKNKDAEEFLEKTLSERSGDTKHTFLFCSTPLVKVLNKVFKDKYPANEIDNIVEKYKVDYIISGDIHRHFELMDENGTHHIISGPGGSHFLKKEILGRFRSATKITVYPDEISRELLVCNKFVFTDNSIRHYIYNKIVPLAEKKPYLFNGIISAIIINLLAALFVFIKAIKV